MFNTRVPAIGHAVYFISGRYDAEIPPSLNNTIPDTPLKLENEFFIVCVDPGTGNLSRVFDKARERELIDDSSRGNCILAIKDEGDSEGRFKRGSDRIPSPTGPQSDVTGVTRIRVVESGPIRYTIEIQKTFHSSRFVQQISLCRGIPLVDFHLLIDWHDVHYMIKVMFPIKIQDPIVTSHVPYAAIARPADGHEYPMQYWVDLSGKDYGVALFNDSRNAYDVIGNEVRLSILRSPTRPALNSDEGLHVVKYALFPHDRAWNHERVMQRAYDFNYPLLAREVSQHDGLIPALHSWLSIVPDSIIIEVIKPATEKDGIVLRLFESRGQETKGTLSFSRVNVKKIMETDMLEHECKLIPIMNDKCELAFRSFEIKTLIVR